VTPPTLKTAPISAVLFDLGGTCIAIDHERIARILRAHGVSPSGDWAHAGEAEGRRRLERSLARGETGLVQWRAFFDGMLTSAGCAPESLDSAFDQLVSAHRDYNLWTVPMPGIADTLRALVARGYRVAAISNSDGRAEWLCAQVGLAHEFEFIVDSHVVGFEKPDPRIFAVAVERLGLHAGQCAYVGDVHGIDVVGARAAGLWPVLLDAYGSYPPSNGEGPARAAEPAQLLGLFPRAHAAHGESEA
jgi:putative hydrolase of the HAD superfamily